MIRMRSAILTLLSSLFWLMLTVVITLALVSCGGGGSSSSLADGGMEGTGISAGSVTDFGSIFVNGVEFETSGATITLNGNAVSESDLSKGMVATVQGTINGSAGVASTVVVEDTVKGPVQSIAADGLSLVVLGQTVLVDSTTIIDNSIPGGSINGLSIGNLVEIHGFVKANGVVGASFVELKAALVEFRVKGFVENTNTTAQTFTIGALTVDYSAADTSDLVGGNPVDEQLVEVKGQNVLGPSGELLATKVEPEGLGVIDAGQAEIEGFVTSIVAPNEFVLGNQTVQTNSATLFEGGLQGEIVVGTKLEVEGMLAGGILTATKVSFHDNVRLEGDIAGVSGNTLTVVGLPGIIVNVDSQTEIKGSANDIGDIAVGDHVRIRGRVTSGTNVTASRLEERSADTDVTLQGPVDTAADPNLVILGVTVDTSGILENDFQGLDDQPIGRAAFFSAVGPGRVVKVQGVLAGSIVLWDQAELED